MPIIGRSLEHQPSLFSSAFGKTFLEFGKKITSPIFWQSNESGSWEIEGSGTTFFIKIEGQILAVTAAHVIDGYLARKKAYANTSFHIGECEIELESRLVSNGSSCGIDIATLRLRRSELKEINRIALEFSNKDFPLKRIEQGNRLLVCGYPAIDRRNEFGKVTFGALKTSPIVESTNERQISFIIERENAVIVSGEGYPEEGSSLGGISGAPMLIATESESGIIQFNLVGIVSDASNSIGEIVQGWHASFLSSSGVIKNNFCI